MTITLVTGPPCAGKTTYVREHAPPGAVVLDFDDIAREVGGSHQHAHSTRTKEAAEAVMRYRMTMLRGYDGDAFVIRSVPDPLQRVALARYLGADQVVVVNPGLTTCITRARTRPRGTAYAIRNWYLRYRDAPCDTVRLTGWPAPG